MNETYFAKLSPFIRDIVCAIASYHGIGVAAVNLTGSLNKSQRTSGCLGRVYVVLKDTQSGWRSKDNNPCRELLKTDIMQSIEDAGLGKWAVMLQASYSEVVPIGNGMLGRRDASGRIIGAYEE